MLGQKVFYLVAYKTCELRIVVERRAASAQAVDPDQLERLGTLPLVARLGYRLENLQLELVLLQEGFNIGAAALRRNSCCRGEAGLNKTGHLHLSKQHNSASKACSPGRIYYYVDPCSTTGTEVTEVVSAWGEEQTTRNLGSVHRYLDAQQYGRYFFAGTGSYDNFPR